jgi:molybdate-binding protein/predicted nucleic acid-binding protein
MARAESSEVRALVDLSYCLGLIREARTPRRGQPLLEALQRYAPGEVGIAAPTIADLLQRAATSRDPSGNRAALEQFLLPLVAVPFDARAALQLADLRSHAADDAAAESVFVAATALALEAHVMTTAPCTYAGLNNVRVETLSPLPRRTLPDAPRAANVILAMGSHDLTLELVGDHLHTTHPEVIFASAHVGSLAGMHALLRGDAHLAGVHLLDEESGRYNEPTLRALFEPEGRHAVLVGFVQRVQGLVVAAGNPHQIFSVEDAVGQGLRFANRQPGSGTRVLLDRELRLLGVEGAEVRGYDRVEQSHSGVASAVASGRADCGLGIEASARARGLDFVPLFKERYDLAIPSEHYQSARLAPLLALLRDPGPELLRAISALGGYTTEGMGQLLAEF